MTIHTLIGQYWVKFKRLDQYTRLTLIAVSWNSEFKWRNELGGPGQWVTFLIPLRESQGAYLVPFLSTLQIITWRNHISGGNSQIDLTVKVNDPHIQYQLQDSHDAYYANLVTPSQICDELPCGQGKDCGRTEGQTDTGNGNGRSAWKAKG